MRVTTIVAFIAGYAFAHYGVLEGEWASLSPRSQLVVATMAVGLVVTWWFDKHIVSNMEGA